MQFRKADPGVVVDPRTGTATGQDHDMLDGINFVFGSDHHDLLRGDRSFNEFSGFGGSDVLVGRGGPTS